MEILWKSNILLILAYFISVVGASIKYNQRTFITAKAINFIDPTKHGFRVILLDEFLKTHLAPTLLPTLYITAIPFKKDEVAISKVFYPDTIYEDKQINISDLKEKAWYYLCIEWENFNRHNETTGTDCRIYRTLDRYGKGADTTVTDIEATDVSSQMFMFRIRSVVDFPIRITASLQGGNQASSPPSQVFHVTDSADLDVTFPYLKPDKDYGKLCILEEPLISGYTAMGRLITGMTMEKCYFENLKTKDYELSMFDSEASAFKRAAMASKTFSKPVFWLLFILSSLAGILIGQR
uniref:Uncharacterized protein n=1 Tax=Acrobeloides nanus TaxID=290746 RepID=A0A914DYC9_9BILA